MVEDGSNFCGTGKKGRLRSGLFFHHNFIALFGQLFKLLLDISRMYVIL